MTYLSLYRRWRSQSFAEVVGQNHIVQTLKNSLDTGRITHAYLFAGPRGTGKTTLARLYAKGLNCVNGPSSEFCQECTECVQITQGSSLDVIEIDGASNRGIDEIRELREQVRYAPVNSRYKVYIIDEVHMLTPDAFNALLKTLEEPPERVVFIFATTDPQKIPATILSRCQRYDFKRFSVEEITNHLQYVLTKEGVTPEAGALEIIAEHADGGMRDALGIADQCLAYSDRLTADVVSEVLGVAPRSKITAFLQALDQKDAPRLIEHINGLYIDGKDLTLFVHDLLRFLRNGIVHPQTLQDIGITWDSQFILRVMEAFAECEREMRYINDTSVPLELAVLKLIQSVPETSTLEIERLETKINEMEVKVAQLLKDAASIHDKKHDIPAQSELLAAINPSSDEQEKLKTIRDNWYNFLQTLHDERLVQPEAFLREGYPVGFENNTLIIAFPSKRGFHKASIEQEKHRQPVEHALSKMFGCEILIRCIISDEFQYESEESPAADQETADSKDEPMQTKNESGLESGSEPEYDEAVNAALRIFGGKIIDIKKDEKGGS